MDTRTVMLTFLMLLLVSGNPLCAQVNELRAGDQGPFKLQVAGQSAEHSVDSQSTVALDETKTTLLPGVVQKESAALSTNAIDFPGLLKQLATSTLLVLCLCVASLWLIKKFRFEGVLTRNIKRPQSAPQPDLQLESSLPLGGRNSLHVVRAGNTRLAVGMDASGIKSIVPLGSVFSQNLDAMESAPSTPSAPTPQLRPAGPDPDFTGKKRSRSREFAHGSIERFGNYHGNPVL